MITEDYVSFEIAELLKKKGFHALTFAQYAVDGDIIPCPTLQMAMKWLREVHNLHISICVGLDSDTEQHYFFASSVHRFKKSGVDYITPFSDDFDTAEEAAEAAIKYCLENLI